MSYTLYSGTSPAQAGEEANLLAVGEETFSRELLSSSVVAQASGQMRLTFFTARKTESSTQCRLLAGATAAGATPSLCKIAIFEIAANGDGSLAAVTVNDTALFAAANTAYTRAWAAPFTKTAGRRYAMGALVVTAATMPNFVGQLLTNAATLVTETFTEPKLAGYLAGLADVPNSFTAAAVFGTNNRPYGVVLP